MCWQVEDEERSRRERKAKQKAPTKKAPVSDFGTPYRFERAA